MLGAACEREARCGGGAENRGYRREGTRKRVESDDYGRDDGGEEGAEPSPAEAQMRVVVAVVMDEESMVGGRVGVGQAAQFDGGAGHAQSP